MCKIRSSLLLLLSVLVFLSCSVKRNTEYKGECPDFSKTISLKTKTHLTKRNSRKDKKNQESIKEQSFMKTKRSTETESFSVSLNHSVYHERKIDLRTKEIPPPDHHMLKIRTETYKKPIFMFTKSDRLSKNSTNSKSKKSKKRWWAIIIGVSLFLMAMTAGLSFPVTAANIIGVRIGWVIIFILDLVVSLGVFKYYKKEKRKNAFLTGLLRVIYSGFLGVAALQLFSGNVMNSIASFTSIWGLGLIVFGLHLIFLGILFNNENGKKWVNITIKTLLILAGIGYLIQYIGILFVANPVAFVAVIEPIFLLPAILGEILFALWMLIKGGKES